MGTRESLGRGSVQFMTAGTGIRHAEQNLQHSPLRFVQIWITPRQYGLEPLYGGFDGTTAAATAARKNAFTQLVGDQGRAEHGSVPVRIAQDCSMYVAEIEPGVSLQFTIAKGRQAYILCVEGSLTVGGTAEGDHPPMPLVRHDAAELRGEGKLQLTAGDTPAHTLLMEMAEGPGGRGPGKWPLHM
jgi:redox-sensitive bicupin YhaK (pirin superfamily)